MPEGTHVIRFGPFLLYPAQRTLMMGDKPLRVGSRSFDLLVTLCEKPGEVVSNQELLASAWPNRVVEEGSLRVHIGALRKLLGDGEGGRRYITNVPLRGYCFVAPVEAGVGPVAEPTPVSAPATVDDDTGLGRAASALTRLVGRDRETAELTQRLRERRCITLVGPGGIGKTSVAMKVARQLGESHGYELVVVELAALSAPELVPMAIASALGIVVPPNEPMPAIVAFLRSRTRLLLVLDNCEQVIDAVAMAAERVLTQAPGVQLLSTSREALRIQGEWVQRLGSLSLPPTDVHLSAQEALQYPAVQLFVERACAGAGTFEMTDADTPPICALCRRLDGIPLAIELAAAAVDMVGVSGLADGLGSRLALLGRGRRTALPRHQTLRATLDWSHDLLSADEQDLLGCLSVFRSSFTHAAAVAVFGRPLNILDDSLSGLVAKSLLATDLIGEAMGYRLLETTREYAGERLASGGTAREVSRRHALHMQDLLRQAENECNEHARATWAIAHARWVDDLRAAVNWAFSPDADECLGISLMAWSAPLWFALSKMAEYRSLAERALAIIDASHNDEVDPEEEMRLCEALGHALWHTRGGGVSMANSFRRALAIADRLQATPYRLRCLWGLWLICNTMGDYAGSRSLALQFGEIIADTVEPGAQLMYERMMSVGLHLYGDQGTARFHAQRVMEYPLIVNHTARNTGFQFDQRVAALTLMSRVLWMQGLSEQALRHAEEAVEEALSIDHALSLCYTIANGAAPIAFWIGDRVRARKWTALLRQRADERSLYFWQAFADVFQLMIHREEGVETSHAILSSPAVGTLLRETLCTVRPEFADETLFARAKRGESGWCTAELLRVAGERSLATGDLATAESHFVRGIEVSRQQQALSWNLRCSTSLARTWHQGGASAKARDMLESVVQGFKEGFETQDLRAAHALLQGALR